MSLLHVILYRVDNKRQYYVCLRHHVNYNIIVIGNVVMQNSYTAHWLIYINYINIE